MTPEHRDEVIRKLRRPGPQADRLIEYYLGDPNSTSIRSYTSDVETALTLLPQGVHFLCGRSGEGKLFWCDIGFRPQVQGWGETLACAIVAAVFAYFTHPEVQTAAGACSSPRPS